jgi:hypothetical protein
MILALLIGCLTPEMFAARRTEQICEYIAECAPAAIPEYCSMSRKELEDVSEGSCPGGFDPDLAAKCLATFEIECHDPDATWPDCSNMADFCQNLPTDTGE